MQESVALAIASDDAVNFPPCQMMQKNFSVYSYLAHEKFV
jgi:hypothetical protein